VLEEWGGDAGGEAHGSADEEWCSEGVGEEAWETEGHGERMDGGVGGELMGWCGGCLGLERASERGEAERAD
jgi:hypothetical protein